jgi:hypothetical protein
MCLDLKGCFDFFLQITLTLTLETRVLITLITYLHGVSSAGACVCKTNRIREFDISLTVHHSINLLLSPT